MAEKFCLKWNDFNSNITKSFGLFRNEAYLHDVTLVSDDHTNVSAHKFVLSACSEYFRDIFKNNLHSHPLLCLDGISTEDLRNIMDYMYNGEVNIFQDKLERFLVVAQRLKLEGLNGGDTNEKKLETKEEATPVSESNSSPKFSKVLSRKKSFNPTGNEIVPAEIQDTNELNEKKK